MDMGSEELAVSRRKASCPSASECTVIHITGCGPRFRSWDELRLFLWRGKTDRKSMLNTRNSSYGATAGTGPSTSACPGLIRKVEPLPRMEDPQVAIGIEPANELLSLVEQSRLHGVVHLVPSVRGSG